METQGSLIRALRDGVLLIFTLLHFLPHNQQLRDREAIQPMRWKLSVYVFFFGVIVPIYTLSSLVIGGLTLVAPTSAWIDAVVTWALPLTYVFIVCTLLMLLPNRFYIALRGLYDWWEYWKIADFARFINRLGDTTEDYVPRLPGEPPRQASFRAAIYIVDQLPRLHLRRDRRIAAITARIEEQAAAASSAREGLVERLVRAAHELRHNPPAY